MKKLILVFTAALFGLTSAKAQLQLSQKLDYSNPPLTYYRITDDVRYTEIDFSKQKITANDNGTFSVKLPFVVNKAAPEGELFWLLLYAPNGSTSSGWGIYTESDKFICESFTTYRTADATYLIQTQDDLTQQVTAGKYYIELTFSAKPTVKDIKVSVAYSTQAVLDEFKKVLNENKLDDGLSEFREGNKAYNNNDYAKAFEWFTKAADKGNADAMSNIGVMYYGGQGVTQDYAKAFEWSVKAADKGDADAMYGLGMLYYNGHGVTRDYAKAREWYAKAAENGLEGAKAYIEEIDKLFAQENADKAAQNTITGAELKNTSWRNENDKHSQYLSFMSDKEMVIIQTTKETGRKVILSGNYTFDEEKVVFTSEYYSENMKIYKLPAPKSMDIPLTLFQAGDYSKVNSDLLAGTKWSRLFKLERYYDYMGPKEGWQNEQEEGCRFESGNVLKRYHYNYTGETELPETAKYAFDGKDGIMITGVKKITVWVFTVNGSSLDFTSGVTEANGWLDFTSGVTEAKQFAKVSNFKYVDAAKADAEVKRRMDMDIAHSNAYNKPNRMAGTKWNLVDDYEEENEFEVLERSIDEYGYEFINNSQVKYCRYGWSEFDDAYCHCDEIMTYTFDETTGTIRIKEDPESDFIYQSFELSGNKIYRLRDEYSGERGHFSYSKVSAFRYINCK